MRTLILCDRGPTQVALFETLQGSILEVVGFVDQLARFIALAAESRPELALIAGFPAGDRNTLESAKWAMMDLGLKCAVIHTDGNLAQSLGYVVIVPPFGNSEIEAAIRGESSGRTPQAAPAGGSQAAVAAALADILSDGTDEGLLGLDDPIDVGDEPFDIDGIADMLEPPSEEERNAAQQEHSAPAESDTTLNATDNEQSDSSSVGIDVRDIFGGDEFGDSAFGADGDLSAAFATLVDSSDTESVFGAEGDLSAAFATLVASPDAVEAKGPAPEVHQESSLSDSAAPSSESAPRVNTDAQSRQDPRVSAAVPVERGIPDGARSFRAVAESGAVPVAAFGDNAEPSSGARSFVDVAEAAPSTSAPLVAEPPVPDPQSAPHADKPPAPRVEGRDITLAMPTTGTFEQTSVEQVLFNLHVLKATGAIQFSGSGLKVDLAVCSGEFGLAGRSPSARDTARLIGAFAWPMGTFRFTSSPQRNFQPMGAALELIELACERHIAFEKIAMSVSADMNRYPVLTQRSGLVESVGLQSWLSFVDGQQPLANLLIPSEAVQGEEIRHAYFAALTGMLVYFEAPNQAHVAVTYNGGASQRASSPSGESEGEMLDEHVFERDPSIRINTDSTDRDELDLDTMREQSRVWKAGGDYVVFDLEPGCGVQAVSDRYYELVKTHHPDVHASRRSQELKRVAERLFMQIQRSFPALRRAESASAAQSSEPESAVRVERVEPPPARPQPERPERPLRAPLPSRPNTGNATSSGENRRVRPTTSRLTAVRSRTTGATPAVPVAVKPDQLVIQARRAARESQYDNVAKMIAQAVDAGYTNFDTAALGPLSAYMIKDIPGPEARKQLEAVRKELETSAVEESRLETYLGHVARMESDQRTADKHYRRAARLDPDNLEAVRWTRHLHRQKVQDAQKADKGIFGGLFQKNKK